MKTYRHHFNLVEIALAIAIIAFGMSSILVLFPVGLNASRDSMGDNYCSNAVEQFIAYIQADSVNPADSSPHDGIGDKYSYWFISPYSSGTDYLLPSSKAPDSDINQDSKLFVQKLQSGAALNPIAADWTIYRAADNGGLSGSKKSIYFIVHRANTGSDSIKFDFMAAMNVWKSPVKPRIFVKNTGEVQFNSSANDDTTTAGREEMYKYSAGLNIEISWPLNKDYRDRQKRNFFYIIDNPL